MKTKLQEIIHSETGKYIFSIVLGIGLASLFRKACTSRNCLIFKAPKLKSLQDVIYKYDNKCYKFHEEAIKCSKNKKTVEFA
jgi:hypothetical protein